MKNLKKPVEEWVMDSARMGADRYESVTPELMDVCGDCKVEGGCDDKSIYCELVAVHGVTADDVSARGLVHSRRYVRDLCAHKAVYGDTPYPEQRDMIATELQGELLFNE